LAPCFDQLHVRGKSLVYILDKRLEDLRASADVEMVKLNVSKVAASNRSEQPIMLMAGLSQLLRCSDLTYVDRQMKQIKTGGLCSSPTGDTSLLIDG
jgi:hypothetical protein